MPGYAMKLSPMSEKTISKNEMKPIAPFWVCDIESYQWINFVMIGLTNGETFQDFSVSKSEYEKWLKFKPILASGGRCPPGPFTAPIMQPCFRRLPPARPTKTIKPCMERFFEYLVSDGVDKQIYAHFGGKFDFQFLLDYLLWNEDWRVENIIPRGSGILCFDASTEMGNGHTVKLRFNDSSAMLPFGLKSLTTNFKVESPKQDWDHLQTLPFATEALIKYCEFDCRGLHQVISKYHSWPLIKSAGSATTIASQAMRVLRTKMVANIWSLSRSTDEDVRKAYFGGRVEIFKPLFEGPGKLRCYDVNSLYPTVMREVPRVGDIPDGYPTKFITNDFNYRPDSIGFYEAEVEVPDHMYVPPLGVNWLVDGETKFIFPTGRFKGVWSTLELEYARSIGVKILSTDQGTVFENGGNFFKQYVDDLYEIRENSERDSVDNVIAKLLLNSCYGRFGIRIDRENLVVDPGFAGAREGRENDGYEIQCNGRFKRFMRQEIELKTFNNVAVSAWVTSASRVFMHRKYMEDLENLYYTDTDSIFTTSKYKDEPGLGGMKLEYDCTSICFHLPKTYRAEGINGDPLLSKVTMKGFERKKCGAFSREDFNAALEGDVRRLSVHQAPRFATFKTALGKGKLLTMLPGSFRQIRSMYDKRVTIKGSNQKYDTRPHKIKNGEPIVTVKLKLVQ